MPIHPIPISPTSPDTQPSMAIRFQPHPPCFSLPLLPLSQPHTDQHPKLHRVPQLPLLRFLLPTQRMLRVKPPRHLDDPRHPWINPSPATHCPFCHQQNQNQNLNINKFMQDLLENDLGHFKAHEQINGLNYVSTKAATDCTQKNQRSREKIQKSQCTKHG